MRLPVIQSELRGEYERMPQGVSTNSREVYEGISRRTEERVPEQPVYRFVNN
jgi:hypothetical protein